MSVTLTESELAALYWWPFPPPEEEFGWDYGFVALRHRFTATAAGERAASPDDRVRWVALAAGTAIDRAFVLQQSADHLGGDAVRAATRAAFGLYVDGVVASPPKCEVRPRAAGGITVVVGGIVIKIPPVSEPPVPPHWDSDERLTRVDLIGVATRFQAAAAVTTSPELGEDLLTAAESLFAAAEERL